ncbi:MAG TPA: hypothetical protein VGS79_12240 [Puia sp.]|nr:hypothetical protein [Puia sp.]
MRLIINGYEFGQWLRRSRIGVGLLQLRMEGPDEGGAFPVEREDVSKDLPQDGEDERVDTERPVKEGEDDYKENLYKGILWMKEKYEQYRDLADERYERLKDQLVRMEQKYGDLLTRVQGASPGLLEMEMTVPASVEEADSAGGTETQVEEFRPEPGPLEFSGGTEIIVERAEASGDRIRVQELEEQLARTQQRFDEEVSRLRYQLEDETARGRRLHDEKNAGLDANRLLEQQVLHLSRQLEEKQRMIADLEGQLVTDRLKIEDLVTKLRNNSTLLMNIYQELDKSLHFSEGPPRE